MKHTIERLAEHCPFCPEGKAPKKNGPVFEVTGPAYSGAVCAAHLKTLIEANGEKPKAE